MTIPEFIILILAGGGGIVISIGFWLLIAKEEFIDSCQRYTTEKAEPDYSTFPPKTIHPTEE